MTTTLSRVREQAEAARAASRRLGVASTDAKNDALERIAALLLEREDAILAENEKDLVAGREAGLDDYFLERLTLTPARIAGMAADTRHIASLPDPVGETIDARTLPNGLQISRKRVPLGVVACIYESRPNVTIDIATLCLKSGNAAVLRGGKEAVHSNAVLGDLLRDALDGSELPTEAAQVIRDPDRAHIDELLRMHDVIDLMVPRGGAGLISYVRGTATMPVVAHGEAVSHTYVDAEADLAMALKVVDNAKTRRYSICNALDTLLVHEAVAPDLLRSLGERWAGTVTLLGDDRSLDLLAGLNVPGLRVEPAGPDDWDTEHLALRAGVRVVDSMDEGAGAHRGAQQQAQRGGYHRQLRERHALHVGGRRRRRLRERKHAVHRRRPVRARRRDRHLHAEDARPRAHGARRAHQLQVDGAGRGPRPARMTSPEPRERGT